MFGLIALAVSIGGAWLGYGASRRFVRDRLRYVDAALSPGAAIVAGLGAAIIAAPVVWFLPVVGAGTAVAIGLGVGLGTRAGATDVKKGYLITDGRY